MLEALYRALRRRDVYVEHSRRWGDPRARLLDGPACDHTRPRVLTALQLTDPAPEHLRVLTRRLDAAYVDLAARLHPHGNGSRTRWSGWFLAPTAESGSILPG